MTYARDCLHCYLNCKNVNDKRQQRQRPLSLISKFIVRQHVFEQHTEFETRTELEIRPYQFEPELSDDNSGGSDDNETAEPMQPDMDHRLENFADFI